MTSADSQTIRRILVAIDASRQDLESLEHAAELAACEQAKLTALFVEDATLFQLAELPFAQEYDLSSGSARALEPQSVARALRAEAERMRRRLHLTSRRRRISAELKVLRGHYLRAAITASGEGDALLLSGSSRIRFRVTGIASARDTAGHRSRGRPIWVLVDDSAASQRGLRLACRVSRERAARLHVLLPREQDTAALRDRVRAIAGSGIAVSFEQARLTEQLRGPLDCELFFVPRHALGEEQEKIERLLADLHRPLVLVS